MLQPIEFLAAHGREPLPWSLRDALRYTRVLTKSHYENFTVASLLLPRRLRQDYCNVYAYCRWSDDLADETGDPALSAELLRWWQGELQAMSAGRVSHPVFVALRETVARHALPTSDFEDLLTAFLQDQTVLRYRTFDELVEYCRYSANPVGRIVLRLNGCDSAKLFALSDAICTALQMANHWQDVRRDWELNRVYIPGDVMRSHGYSVELLADDIARGTGSLQYKRTIDDLVARATALFASGLPLANHFGGRLGIEIELFARAGMAVLDQIRSQNCDTIARRPTVSGFQRSMLLLRVATRRLWRSPRITQESSYVRK